MAGLYARKGFVLIRAVEFKRSEVHISGQFLYCSETKFDLRQTLETSRFSCFSGHILFPYLELKKVSLSGKNIVIFRMLTF